MRHGIECGRNWGDCGHAAFHALIWVGTLVTWPWRQADLCLLRWRHGSHVVVPNQSCESSTPFLCNNKVHYQSGKCTFQMETENAFDLWELISRSTNKIVSVHFTFSTRNSSQFPPIRTGRLLSQNDLSGKDQSSIANLYIRGILGCHHLLSTLECV